MSSVRSEIKEIRDLVVRIDERQEAMHKRLDEVETRAGRNGGIWGALTAFIMALPGILGVYHK